MKALVYKLRLLSNSFDMIIIGTMGLLSKETNYEES